MGRPKYPEVTEITWGAWKDEPWCSRRYRVGISINQPDTTHVEMKSWVQTQSTDMRISPPTLETLQRGLQEHSMEQQFGFLQYDPTGVALLDVANRRKRNNI